MTQAKSPLFVYLLLDRSGSMEECRDRTIDAVNEYINGLKLSDDIDARLTLTTFDSQGIDTVTRAAPASAAPKLTRETYVPRASTPLLDAIGQAVTDTDNTELRQGEKVSLVIVTDGQENASREFKRDTVKKLLEGRQKDKRWLISFLGADIDAFAEGGGIGVAAAYALQTDKAKLKEAFMATQALQARFTKSAGAPAGYTAAERKSADKD